MQTNKNESIYAQAYEMRRISMNDTFAILTDSTSNLPYKYIQKYGIHVLSLKYLAGDREYPGYEENGDETFQEIYWYLRQGRNVTTSMVNVNEAYEMAKPVLEAGKDLLYIGLSSKLSGTYHAVESALHKLRGEYPERNIYAVDSLCVALGEGLLIYGAVRMQKKDKSIEQVYDWCNQCRWKVTTIFTVDDLKHLKRSGRASSVTSLVGTVLQIKVLLRMSRGGVLTQEAKVRGRKKSLDEIVKRALRDISQPQTVFISHGDCYEDAKYVADRLRTSDQVKRVILHTLDPVIGVHTGPGSIGIFFVSD